MEYDLLIGQNDQLVQLAEELASASELLATRMGGDETAIPAPSAYRLLTNLLDTLVTLATTTEGLRGRLVESLYRSGIGLHQVDLVTGDTRDAEESILAADADILSSAASLELTERCLDRARNAIAAQGYARAIGAAAPTSGSTP